MITFLLACALLFCILIIFWTLWKLRAARIRNEFLLKNMLPKFVIEELKDKKIFYPRNVQNVSVIFIDIVRFTPFTSQTAPEAVVHILDEIFSIFDQLSIKYALEKIKTIGDAYMAVSGLIAPQVDHANKAIDFALDAIEQIKQYNARQATDFSLRVGIDSGTVTSGIIGTQKFSYDLWGNVVNRASRMQTTSEENKVQITEETRLAIKKIEKYHITAREKWIVKGLGGMCTYFIETDPKLLTSAVNFREEEGDR